MANALENFFNWQSDQDWWWGPLLYLRPPKNVRMTLRFWLRMIGIGLLVTVPAGAIIGSLLVYYDYTTAKHHETKIPPVIVTENWVIGSSPQAVLSSCALLIAIGILGCICQHWAWNRRADRLSREPIMLQTAAADMSGVWPPPPRTMP